MKRTQTKTQTEIKVKKAEWKTRNGQTLSATVELITKKTIWADGDEVDVKCCEIEIKYHLNEKYITSGRPIQAPEAGRKLGFSWVVGKIGMTEETYELVKSAIEKVEEAPEWQAKVEAQKEADKVDYEYAQHTARVDRMMAE